MSLVSHLLDSWGLSLIGDKLEKAGWRQGSIIKSVDTAEILEFIGHSNDDSLVLIVASQSCDITYSNLKSDPNIELSVARRVETINGNLTHNKNPRVLHTTLQIRTNDADIYRKQHVELKAYEKYAAPKECLIDLTPDNDSLLNATHLEGYISWLAARYSRPALPTEFNNRISAVDPKEKLRKKAKGANEQLSGIYVEIIPDAEIPRENAYRVNLLGLVSAGFEGDLAEAELALNEYAEIMRWANVDVAAVLRKENEVSIAEIKRFKRFYYDDLSFKGDAPLPAEVETIL